MSTFTMKWLSERVPEFGQLPDEEKAAIGDFAMLWTLFEAWKLDNNANMEALRNYVATLSEATVDSLALGPLTDYFRARYMDGVEFSYRCSHLHLERSGNPSEVRRMLRGEVVTNPEALVGCLGIVLRYRNNLFHGEKWTYQLQEQGENFARANDLLLKLLEAGP